jgi:VCBS repeat-containing protein
MSYSFWSYNWWNSTDSYGEKSSGNYLPTGKDATRTINEDASYTVRKSDFGFSDGNSRDTLAAVRIDAAPARGTLTLNGVAVTAGQLISAADIDAGRLVYTPAADESGNAYGAFRFSVKDSAGGVDKAPNTFTFNVCPVNDGPDARDDAATTAASTAVTVDVKANDSDPDNTRAELTVTSATLADPSQGQVRVNADGTLTFKPADGVTGPVQIQYTLKDPGGLSDKATLTVDVKPADPQPEQCISFDFSGSSKLDGADGNVRSYTASGVSVHVSAFSREKGDSGAWSAAWLGSYGGGLGVTDSQEGTGGDNGHTVDNICRDNFLLFEFDQEVVLDRAYLGYVVCDSDVKVWIGTVPGAFDSHLQLSDAVLASMGFTEVNQTTLTSARWADLNAGEFAGNVIIIAADTTDKTPEDQFKLQKLEVCTVVPADTPPEGADVTRSVAEDNAYVVRSADFGFRDADGHAFTAVRIDTTPGNGSLTLNGVAVVAGQLIAVADIDAGNLRFAPDADESGAPYASFTFSVQDSSGSFDLAPNTFTFDVAAVNDGPLARPDTGSTDEDTTLAVGAAAGVIQGAPGADSDPEGDPLTVTGVSFGATSVGAGALLAGAHGTLTLQADGSYTYAPAASTQALGPGESVQDAFTYTISDGNGGTASSTLTITVNGLNDAPLALDDSNSALQGNPILGNVLANDSDADGDVLRVSSFLVNGVAYAAGETAQIDGVGSLQMLADGAYVFTPLASFRGVVPAVSYTMTDGSASDSATLSLAIDPVNQPPALVAGPGAAVSEEGLPGGVPDTNGVPADETNATVFSGQVQATDVDGDALSITLQAPAEALSSAGAPVSWSGSGTQALVGSANGIDVIRVNIDDTGRYAVQLLQRLDHPVTGAEDVLTLGVGVTVSDGVAAASATLQIRLEDDAPAVANVVRLAGPVPLDTNLMFVLDMSGSMTLGSGVFVTAPDGTEVELTRLELEIRAIDQLITRYEADGEVRVRIVTFSDDAQPIGSEWVDADTARAQLDTLQTVNWTNYDAALTQAVAAYDDAGRLLDAKSAVYFLSDGNPTAADTGDTFGTVDDNPDIGIDAAEESQWRSFLADEGITAFAIGVGNSLIVDNLHPVAYDGLTLTDTDGVLVEDLSQLATQLLNTYERVSTGNVAMNDTVGTFGADGGYVASVTVDGVAYTFDPAGSGQVNVPPDSDAVLLPDSHHLAVTTARGGTLVVDFDSGIYRYVSDVNATYTESFGFEYVDNDGDRAVATLEVDVIGEGDPGPTFASLSAPDLLDPATMTLEGLLGAGDVAATGTPAVADPSATSTTTLLALELLQRAEYAG